MCAHLPTTWIEADGNAADALKHDNLPVLTLKSHTGVKQLLQ